MVLSLLKPGARPTGLSEDPFSAQAGDFRGRHARSAALSEGRGTPQSWRSFHLRTDGGASIPELASLPADNSNVNASFPRQVAIHNSCAKC